MTLKGAPGEAAQGTAGSQLGQHYDAKGSLLARLERAFVEAGCDPDHLSHDEMAGIDQLHLGGRAASRRLMALAGRDAGQPPNKGDGPRLDAFAGAGTGSSGAARLLDLGCGTGGASRLLARELGYEVVGVDITPGFIEVATWLSRACGLEDSTRFVCADAAELPLGDASVEAVWCQHALLNMPDIAAVLSECRRVLAPGGRLLLHEVVRGDNPAPLSLPVPWARTPEHSRLLSLKDLEQHLQAAGFQRQALEDVSAEALAWRSHHRRREQGGTDRRAHGGSNTDQAQPPRQEGGESSPQASGPAARPPIRPRLPGPALIFGEVFVEMGRNLLDNLSDDRVRVVQGVWQHHPLPRT
ncbi:MULTISPECIES: class I SAM-dependent methyltransferase [unclassified Halomonas]|uniref:class I SAM-dependent methyltransferase n=1 Tax=unclassified Halomonas TaxID=2609666 RepID=UPI000C8CAB67|nr:MULTISPECIES: class I SAM-dependent methyltransferase [unclassified Halomonas]MAR71446.1 methyltransferase type 11 [Halomonas sp.]|tara:strand:+ start:1743 stop:2810 length:1068 start_codon:yes stop_codon:yes gene_type:complete